HGTCCNLELLKRQLGVLAALGRVLWDHPHITLRNLAPSMNASVTLLEHAPKCKQRLLINAIQNVYARVFLEELAGLEEHLEISLLIRKSFGLSRTTRLEG